MSHIWVFAVSGGALSILPYPTVIRIPESEAQNGDAVWLFVVRDEDDDAFTTCSLTGTHAADFAVSVNSALGCAVTFNGNKDFDAGDKSFKIGLSLVISVN